MEVVNVKNVIIKYIPEHIVVETYVIGNNSAATTADVSQQTNVKNKSNLDTAESVEEIYYISMDESLGPDSDAEPVEQQYEGDSSMKEFTEEEYLDDIHDEFDDSDDIKNAESVVMEAQETNHAVQRRGESLQVLKDWFFDHLNVKCAAPSRKSFFLIKFSLTVTEPVSHRKGKGILVFADKKDSCAGMSETHFLRFPPPSYSNSFR